MQIKFIPNENALILSLSCPLNHAIHIHSQCLRHDWVLNGPKWLTNWRAEVEVGFSGKALSMMQKALASAPSPGDFKTQTQ